MKIIIALILTITYSKAVESFEEAERMFRLSTIELRLASGIMLPPAANPEGFTGNVHRGSVHHYFATDYFPAIPTTYPVNFTELGFGHVLRLIYLAAYLPLNVTVIGVDNDLETCEKALQALSKEPQWIQERIRVLCKSVETLTVGDVGNSIAVLSANISHFLSPYQHDILLRNVPDFLLPGGRFIEFGFGCSHYTPDSEYPARDVWIVSRTQNMQVPQGEIAIDMTFDEHFYFVKANLYGTGSEEFLFGQFFQRHPFWKTPARLFNIKSDAIYHGTSLSILHLAMTCSTQHIAVLEKPE